MVKHDPMIGDDVQAGAGAQQGLAEMDRADRQSFRIEHRRTGEDAEAMAECVQHLRLTDFGLGRKFLQRQ